MDADVRDSDLYREVERLYRQMNEPFGEVSTALDFTASPDGSFVAFTGLRRDAIENDPVSRVCVVELATGSVEEVTNGPHDDRLPSWSPDGTTIAFVSDRAHRGRFGLHLLQAGRIGEAWAAPDVDGSVEWLSWSPDGASILLGVAGTGAEKSGVEGSGRVGSEEDVPPWLPRVSTSDTSNLWRRAWRYDVASRIVVPLSREGLNVWEAAWCGNDAIVAVVSDSPGEDAWYDAPLALVDVATGQERLLHKARDGAQLGWPAANGTTVAVVEAACSDRWVVAGDVLTIDVASGAVTSVDTNGTDVTALHWHGDVLHWAGERGLDTVLGDARDGDAWVGEAAAMWQAHPAWLPDGTAVLELTSWQRPAQLARVGRDTDETLYVFPQGGDLPGLGTERRVTWQASDGLTVEGLLYEPADASRPYATVLYVHGGPIGREHTRSAPRQRFVSALLSRGYAVLVPNVRGSAGRGQAYAETVIGDMGGAETTDHLAGLDMLVEEGTADPERLGVMGGSHGGFMTSWLVTQTDRFAAAVAISPVTDWRSQHYTSNIAHFDELFVGPMKDPIRDDRSPLMQVHNVRTPTFLTAGDLDRCTPPGQALEFHQALLERGVPTACAIYPDEGHGVRRFPAVLDWVTRILWWFEEHMPARG